MLPTPFRFMCLSAPLVAALVLAAGPAAAADCRAEVEAAFEKQRTSAPGYHVKSEQYQDNGKVEIELTYQLPDRMHQKVIAPGERAPIETIAVAKWAWGTMGGGWEELQPQFAQSVTAHVADTLGKPVTATGAFECMGKVAIEGRDLVGYRSVAASATQTADASGKAPAPVQRTVYVDPASGLPALNIVSDAGANGKVWARSVFTYPKDLVVDAPVGAAPAPRTR